MMRWHVLAAAFFTTSIAFAEPAAIIVSPANQSSTNYNYSSDSDEPVSPCVTSTYGYAREACERTQQATRARNKQEKEQRQAAPPQMPLWQQALQPPAPPTAPTNPAPAKPPQPTQQPSGSTQAPAEMPAYP